MFTLASLRLPTFLLGEGGLSLSEDAAAETRCRGELLFGIEPQGLKALVFVRDSTVRLQAAPFQNS